MNTRWFLVCSITFFACLGHLFPVAAQEAERSRTQMMLQATPPPPLEKDENGKVKKVFRGMTSVATTKFGTGESFFILAGTKVGFKLQDLIIPWFNGEKEKISTPEYLPDATLNEKFAWYIVPQTIRERLEHYSEANENLISSKFCAVQVNKPGRFEKLREDIESTSVQESSNIEHSQRLYENARLVNAALGLQFILPNTNGIFDMNLAPMIMPNVSVLGFCRYEETSKEVKPVQNDVTKLATFGAGGNGVVYTVQQTIVEFVQQVCDKFGLNCFDEEKYAQDVAGEEVALTEVSQDSNACELGNVGDAKPGTKACEKSPYETTQMLVNTRGWTFNFLPEKQSEVQEIQPGGTQYSYSILARKPDGGNAFAGKDGDIQHPHPLDNNARQREKEAACIASPAKLHKTISFGTKEESVPIECGDETEELQCPIDVIKEASFDIDSACKVGSGIPATFLGGPTGQNTDYPDQKKAYGSGLSPLAIKVLETAATAYKVPASVLLGTMLFEGAFNHPEAWDWSSDEKIEEYSDCNNPSPMKCESFAIDSGSKPPFGWIDGRWNAYMTESTNPYVGKYLSVELDGLDEVLKNVKTFSACNFTDVVFLTARAISEDFSHPLTPTSVPNVCVIPGRSSIPMYTEQLRPESCGSWTDGRVATTRHQYGGGSTQGTCTPADPTNSYNVGYMVDIWNANK